MIRHNPYYYGLNNWHTGACVDMIDYKHGMKTVVNILKDMNQKINQT